MSGGGRLTGKRTIVTGGDSGIGRAIALRFAREGADVVVNYHRDDEGANDVRATIEGEGGRAIVVGADVGTADGARQIVEAAVRAFGGLDILVNNAGIEIRHPFLDVTEDELDLVLGVNLKGPFLCTQAAVRQMLQNVGRGGRVINISSVHEEIPMPGYSPYCAAKGGLRMLTRTHCDELAPHGITINNIGPGAVATPINAATLADPARMPTLNQGIPLGRIAQPEEIAGLATYLASDEAAYVTGATYFIDGGMMRRALGL